MGPAVPDTQGSIYQPMSEGRCIDDGADERMKQNRKTKNKKVN